MGDVQYLYEVIRAREHEAMRALLANFGVDVIRAALDDLQDRQAATDSLQEFRAHGGVTLAEMKAELDIR